MPFEIQLPDSPPIGFVTRDSRKGERVEIATRAFVSSEDADLLVELLEHIEKILISRRDSRILVNPSSIDHFLIVVPPTGPCTVYINELGLEFQARARKPIEAGQVVGTDDIMDVRALRLRGVDLSAEHGIIFLFSVRWRKGLFVDLSPLSPPNAPRDYDLEATLGRHFAYLVWQDRYRLTQKQWSEILRQRWYPFVGLDDRLLRQMITHARNQWEIDELLPRITDHLNKHLDGALARWACHDVFSEHIEILNRAAERYRESDFVSVVSILFPRIEGIMRSLHRRIGSTRRYSSSGLIQDVIEADESRPSWSLLFPDRFQTFLSDVFFENFKPGSEPDTSRHTVAHGEAAVSFFSEKAAAVAVLIVDQLSYFLPDQAGKSC